MDLWTFVTIVTLAGIALSAYQARLKHLRRSRLRDGSVRDEDIEDLKARVATLESIVTDRRSRLKDEIDRL